MYEGTKVRVVKTFRHGTRVFEVGEVGEIVDPQQALVAYRGKSIYPYYVKFPGYYPIGVQDYEIEELL